MGIYNNLEFPTALAYWVTYGCGGEEELCGQERPRHILPRVRVEMPAPPGPYQDHWKGNGRRILAPAVFLSERALSRQHSAFSQGTAVARYWQNPMLAEC